MRTAEHLIEIVRSKRGMGVKRSDQKNMRRYIVGSGADLLSDILGHSKTEIQRAFRLRRIAGMLTPAQRSANTFLVRAVSADGPEIAGQYHGVVVSRTRTNDEDKIAWFCLNDFNRITGLKVKRGDSFWVMVTRVTQKAK